MTVPARLLLVALLPGCFGSGREAVGERIAGNEPSWSVPEHTCAWGSPQTEVGDDGAISQFCHDGDALQGTLVKWHPNSQKAAQGDYHDGERIGLWTWWHPGGQVATRGRFERGKEQGIWTWWHANGQTRMRGDHVDGKRMGLWQTWYPTGQLASTGHFRNGRQDGRWEHFTVQGELARVETFDLGRPVTSQVLIETDEDGHPIDVDEAGAR